MTDLTNGPLCYLATPYSKFERGIEAAFEEAARITAALIRSGVKVYSPIVHCHPPSVIGGIDPLDHTIWIPFDEAMMDAAPVLIVAHMPGWAESFGVAHEIAFFEKRGKPIFDLDPDTMTMTRRKRSIERDRFDDAAHDRAQAILRETFGGRS